MARKTTVVAMLAVGAIALVAGLAAINAQQTNQEINEEVNGAEQPQLGLPECDSTQTTESAKKAVAEAPIGTQTGIRIIYLSDQKQVSETAEERRCTGNAFLNNGSEVAVTYRLFTKPAESQWFIYVQFGEVVQPSSPPK